MTEIDCTDFVSNAYSEKEIELFDRIGVDREMLHNMGASPILAYTNGVYRCFMDEELAASSAARSLRACMGELEKPFGDETRIERGTDEWDGLIRL
jgi:hypothetical protein